MKLVKGDSAASNRVDLDVQLCRYLQMGMIRTFEVGPRLPVVGQQFLMEVIEEPVLIHPCCHPPLPAQWTPLRLDNREDMDDTQE